MSDTAPEEAAQAPVARFLASPEAHGGAPVEMVVTPISRLFLAGERAFKMKRAVRTNFLDFSTLAAREAMCRRELAVNAAAGALYRGVVAVTRAGEGFAIGGAGEPVEWLVEMARFDRAQEFDRLAARGALDRPTVEALADAVAALHAAAPRAQGADGAARTRARIDQIAEATADASGGGLDAAGWRDAALAEAARHARLLDARRRHGCVRRGHGDLHLGNVVLIDGRPTPFDAIEFNEDIATDDVLYDAAFTVMDLTARADEGLAGAFLSRYLTATRDYAGLALLPLFVSMRAAVRAMVSWSAERETAEARFALATAALASRPAPRLVAVGGPSGSGKSTLARALAPVLGAAPGAVILRSDVARKRLFGVAPEAHLPAEAYGAEAGARVYRRLLRDAGRALGAGAPVILDAAFLAPDERAAAAALAARAGLRFDGLWLSASEAAMAERLDARRGDASDADAAVMRRQLARLAPPEDWARVDADGPPDAAAAAARAALGL
jgi:aminoglycoside phosphotransferase family enzyme